MPYKLSRPVWIEEQANRVAGVLIQQLEYPQAYPKHHLQQICRNFGLKYSTPEWDDILPVLLDRGLLVETTP